MSEQARQPNRTRLRFIAAFSALLGLFSCYIIWQQVRLDADGWIWWVIIATLGLIVHCISFYFGVIWFENTLEQFIKSDTFGKKHGWIDVKTETRDSGDPKIDQWVAHYKFARTLLAMGLLPLIAFIYLFCFA